MLSSNSSLLFAITDPELHEHYVEIPSTNDRLLELARLGAPAGTIVSADYQSAGRGRRGAVWVSPPGAGILCSILFRFSARIPVHHLAILSGVGVANGLCELGFSVKIKWPNDIMFEERKVGGILVETIDNAVVIGFGINCSAPLDEYPEEIRARAGSLFPLAGKTDTHEKIMNSVCAQLADAVIRVQTGGIIKVLRDWNSMNWFAHKKVRVSGPMGVLEGDGVFLDGHRVLFHVFKDCGVVPMPLSSSLETR